MGESADYEDRLTAGAYDEPDDDFWNREPDPWWIDCHCWWHNFRYWVKVHITERGRW